MADCTKNTPNTTGFSLNAVPAWGPSLFANPQNLGAASFKFQGRNGSSGTYSWSMILRGSDFGRSYSLLGIISVMIIRQRISPVVGKSTVEKGHVLVAKMISDLMVQHQSETIQYASWYFDRCYHAHPIHDGLIFTSDWFTIQQMWSLPTIYPAAMLQHLSQLEYCLWLMVLPISHFISRITLVIGGDTCLWQAQKAPTHHQPYR